MNLIAWIYLIPLAVFIAIVLGNWNAPKMPYKNNEWFKVEGEQELIWKCAVAIVIVSTYLSILAFIKY